MMTGGAVPTPLHNSSELLNLFPDKFKRRLQRKEVQQKDSNKPVEPSLNPINKTPISFLQEYCMNVLKQKPEYIVSIQGMVPFMFIYIFPYSGDRKASIQSFSVISPLGWERPTKRMKGTLFHVITTPFPATPPH